MFTKPSLFTLIVIIFLEAGLHPVLGQLPANDHREKVRSDVERIANGGKRSAVVKMKDGSTKKGRIVRVDTDSFDLAEGASGQVATVSYDEVQKIKGPGMSKGAKTAVWIGVAAGAAVLLITMPRKGLIGPICPLGCGL